VQRNHREVMKTEDDRKILWKLNANM